MKPVADKNKWLVYGLGYGFVTLLFVGLSFFFDFYFDLNDDVLIKDIISGTYTGTPDGHSIQMLYPLGWLLSLPYFVFPNIPWFGLFETGCMILSFGLISVACIKNIEKKKYQVMASVALTVLYVCLYAWEMIMVHYSVVCALLAAAAMVWFCTTENGIAPKVFYKKNTITIVLVVLAFLIRTEMLLLMCPFIAVAGIMKWSREEKFFSPDSMKKYLGMVGCIVFGMLLSLGVDKLAYSDEGWKEFRNFFDARTEVYDFTGIPDYEGNKDFYESIGLGEEEYTLLQNYNFGLSSEIDADLLNQIAEYASVNSADDNTASKLVQAAKESVKQLFHISMPWADQNHASSLFSEDGKNHEPFNLLIVIGYVLLLIMAIWSKDKQFVWKLPLLLCARSVAWTYILYRGRVVDRITYPLYLMELSLILGVVLIEKKDSCKKILLAAFVLMLVVAGFYLPGKFEKISVKQNLRQRENEIYDYMCQYMEVSEENYYYVDVYSTVSFSEKIYMAPVNKNNWELLGGWANKSPLSDEKTAKYGFTSETVQEALAKKDTVLFVAEEGATTDWITDFYKGQDMSVKIEEAFAVRTQEASKPRMLVYQISVE